ncbi:hypothetical protein Bbelb_190640 [Branchiostoma belcheri]|nr:hypothetical protein Bbelb_190640 [Branchiostoma belcheri]
MLNQRANSQQPRKPDEEAWKKFKKERDLALKREEAAKNLSHLIAYQKDKRVRELKDKQKQRDAENLTLGKSVKRLKGDLKDTVKGRSKLEQKLRQELKALREQNKKLQKELVVLKEAEPAKSKKTKRQKGERVEDNAIFYSYATEDDELDFETDDESKVPNLKLDSKLRKLEERRKVDRRAPKETSKNASTKQTRENKKERKQSKDDAKRPTSSKKRARKHSAKAQKDATGREEAVKKQDREKQNRPRSREEHERRRAAKKNKPKRTTRHQDDGFDSYSDDDFEDYDENGGESSSNRQNVGEKKSRRHVNNTRDKGQAGAAGKNDGTGGDRTTKGSEGKIRGQEDDLSNRQTRRTKRETDGELMEDNGETSDGGANNDGDHRVGRRKEAGKTRLREGKGREAPVTSDSDLEDSEESSRRKRQDRGKSDKIKSTNYIVEEGTEDHKRQKEYERGRGNKNGSDSKQLGHSEKHKRGQLALDSSSDTDADHPREKRGKTKTHNRADNDHGLPQITLTDDKNTVSLISKQSTTKAPTLDFRNELQESGDERGDRKRLGKKHKSRDDHVKNLSDARGGDGDHHTFYGKSHEPENSAYGPTFSQSHRRQTEQFAKDNGGPHSDMRTELSYKKRLTNKSEWEKFLSENADHVSGVKGMSDGKNRPGVAMATHGRSFPGSYPPNVTNGSPGHGHHFGHSFGHKKPHYNGISVPGNKSVFPTGRRKKSSADDISDDTEESSDVMDSFLGSPVDVNAKIRQYRERAEKIDVQLRRNQRVGMFAVQPAGKTVKERSRVYPTTRILFRTYRNPGQPRATL